MASTHVGPFDARHSTFYHAGRDQTMIHNYNILIISPGGSRQRPPRIAVDTANTTSSFICSPEFLPGSLVAYSSPNALALISAAVGSIDQITELLMDNRQSSSGHRDLALELESLQRSLTLTRLAIQRYDNTPLGRSLANTIIPEVLKCFLVLQDLFNNVDGTWLDFNITTVGGLCRRIWWDLWDGDQFASLRKKLCHSRQSLQALLMALRSYVLLVLHTQSAEITSLSIIYIKCFLDGTRQRIKRRLCIPPKIS
jgi:hypothetical protein